MIPAALVDSINVQPPPPGQALTFPRWYAVGMELEGGPHGYDALMIMMGWFAGLGNTLEGT